MRRGADGSAEGRSRPIPADAFEALAWETGGQLVRLSPDQQMDAPFTQIALDLHGQYMLGFAPAVLDGRQHKLEVRVKRRGVEVRARRSYVASDEATEGSAKGGSRTPTAFRPPDPKSGASASSATLAYHEG